MEIPSVHCIRKSISKKYHNKKLNEILEKRKENRKKWTSIKRFDYDKFLINLKQAHDAFVFALQNEIVSKTKIVIEKDINASEFILIQPQNLDCDIGEFSSNTIFKGIWDKKRNKFDRIPHIEAGIYDIPIIELNEKMSQYGYEITDITEKKKGANTIIKVNLSI